MSQATDYTIVSAPRAEALSDLNSVFGATQSLNSGSSGPSSIAAMLWADSTASPWTIKIRSHDDASWASLFKTDGSINAAGNITTAGDITLTSGDLLLSSGVFKVIGADPLSPTGGTGLVTIESNNSQAANRGPFVAFRAKYTDAGAKAGLGGILVAKLNSTSGNLNSYMAFYTRLSSMTERMRIVENGNVGINVVAPTARLHVDQSSTTAAVPVVIIDQADISEGLINYVASDRGTVDTTGVSASDAVASVRVELNGTIYVMALWPDQ